MAIKIKPYYTLKKALGDRAYLEMEADRITIRQLMEELSNRFGYEFRAQIFRAADPDRDFSILILVNGRNWRNLPDRLDTELKDGDEVCLFPPAVGG